MISRLDFEKKKLLIIFPLDGEKISFSNDNVLIKNNKGKIKNQMTIHLVFAIFIVGGFSVTSKLIEKANKYGICIYLLSTSLKPLGEFPSPLDSNTRLRNRQYTLIDSLEVSKKIIKNKIANQKRMLKKIKTENKEIEKYFKKLNSVKNIHELMGVEGICAKIYFSEMFSKLDWKRRAPRTKEDILNVLLDIGYVVLFNYVDANLKLYGFDLYKGNLHQEFYKRKSLVCDIVEPFRPIIDYKIRKMYNLRQVDKDDFSYINGMYYLKVNCNKKYLKEFIITINDYKSIIFDYVKKYYYWNMNNDKEFPEAIL